jgi:hypothetical protein
MRTFAVTPPAVAMLMCMAFAIPASAHPGSGIVVDRQGQVFFQDTRVRTIWKVDEQGNLTKYTDMVGGHLMALTPGMFTSWNTPTRTQNRRLGGCRASGNLDEMARSRPW